MTPSEYYTKLIESDQILNDPQQAQVIQHLQIIYDHLMLHGTKPGLLQKFTGKRGCLTRGLYLWGDVGIGKTFLMDSFYYCLPLRGKLRIHFHQFMKMIHEQMQVLKGENNPIIKIAKKIANENAVICFDELVVNDITDAMILAGLFETLYKEKTCLLFTSNTSPDNLYLKGIQRDSFLPAIEAIKQNSDIIHLTTQKDYRYRDFIENTYYYSPINAQTNTSLENQFNQQRGNSTVHSEPIRILSRNIEVKKMADRIIWFDFLAICGVPRSQLDYIEIAKKFDTIIVSDVKVIQPEQNDLARAFINLVDVLYDANKKLIISAEKPIEEIYYCGRMLFEFARTRSRLVEMQTPAWHEKVNHN